MTDKIVILCTCSSAAEAEKLARSLVDAGLAACVNVIPQVRSYYRWKGAIESAEEYLLAIKSSRAHFDGVRAHLAQLHSYEVPEILALPVVAGSEDYLDWLDANLGKAAERLRMIAPGLPGGHASGLALIFDMDGVIVDSNPAHRQAWEVFNRRYGIETSEAMHRRMYGKRNDEIVRDFFGDLPAAEAAARGAAKEVVYRGLIGERLESLLVPGLRPFLERYAALPKAVASNAEPANIHFVLDNAGLRRYFRLVVDGNQVSHPKPDPEIYLRAAELLGIAPRNCIVFEDSYAGVEAGRVAGMRVVGILTTHAQLPGTALSVHNFTSGDLPEWLRAQECT